jgi:hypothetical protein
MIDKTNPYVLSFWAGKKVGDFATLLVASPGILLDKTQADTEDYVLPTSRLPKALVELFIPDNELNSYYGNDNVLYKGGFFSKYPLGHVAQAVGFTANAAVSATLAISATLVTVAVGAILLSALVAGGAALLALTAAAAVLAAVVLTVRSCIVGPDEAVDEFKRVMA